MVVISASDAVREYESGDRTIRALKGVDLAVESGEFLAIVGPSGSGKSTLLNLLGLLDAPTSGRVTVHGRTVSELSIRQRTDVRRETVGFVFQSFFLIPTLTARENVTVPGLVRGDRDGLLERADRLLERVGLADRAEHYPDELSGGQKQRVAIARSLVNEPDILLADEPTGNLDRKTGAQVLDIFEEVAGEGVPVLTVTHDEQVTDYADRTVELVDGRIESR
jgi:putative ABC transport system ATP-binding protein